MPHTMTKPQQFDVAFSPLPDDRIDRLATLIGGVSHLNLAAEFCHMTDNGRDLAVSPHYCAHCQSDSVRIIRSSERALLRCEKCGRRLFAFYADPNYRLRAGLQTASEDRFTARQAERELLKKVSQPAQTLYEYLCRYVARHEYAPTMREMQAGMGWQSVSTVRYYLLQLEAVGLIERDYATVRGIRLKKHVA